MHSSSLIFEDSSFDQLMRHRVFNVLLFASKYALFTLEEDGRIEDQLFREYMELNLRYPPNFTLVSSEQEANAMLNARQYELIISMPSGDSINPFEWAKQVKRTYPDIPIVVLTPYNRRIADRIQTEDLSAIDYVFSWLSNSDLLMAIVKLIEDQMNVEPDVKAVGLESVLLVEDSIRQYSAMLPVIYKKIFEQQRDFRTEALNDHEQMLRMRARPKLLLARNYDEALQLYDRWHDNMLGIITDLDLTGSGTTDGLQLIEHIRHYDPHIPIILQSTELGTHTAHVSCTLDKNSKTHLHDLTEAIAHHFGFGPLKFINPTTGKTEATVRNLKQLQDKIFSVTDTTLYYHVSHNHISQWLYARALFPLAKFLKQISVTDIEQFQDVKDVIFNAIVDYRTIKNRGIVAEFERMNYDRYSNFARLGSGSMGSKGRGLAFIDQTLKRQGLETIGNTQIKIPKTVVICTDIFAAFMESNGLYDIALSDSPDADILAAFLAASLPEGIISDISNFLLATNSPIAVRSSSLLEDTQYQPFAGIYSTYMIPYHDNQDLTLSKVAEAIKAVYASVFYHDSKSYMYATKNVIDEERMAVVVQEVCGTAHGMRYYPSFSGVARSTNFYPIGDEQAGEGIANIALGLGKYIVDGGVTLRFSPAHPQHVIQTSTVQYALTQTQKTFYALDLNAIESHMQIDDGFNILKLPIDSARHDGTLQYIASTFNLRDQSMADSLYDDGMPVITFANILKHNVMPLDRILRGILNASYENMGTPVEVEFAVNLDYKQGHHTFYLLQVRPIAEQNHTAQNMPDWETVEQHTPANTLIFAHQALGAGNYDDISDIIYLQPQHFKAENTQQYAQQIDTLNRQLLSQGRHYMLITLGRLGSSDPWLGVPVKWAQICGGRVFVECAIKGYHIEPSQGTHFFQNLTSFEAAYLTLDTEFGNDICHFDMLDTLQAEHQFDCVRHVTLQQPLHVSVDSRANRAIITLNN